MPKRTGRKAQRRPAERPAAFVRVQRSLEYTPREVVLHTDSGQVTTINSAASGGTFTLAGLGGNMTWLMPAGAGLYFSSFAMAFGLSSFPNYTQWTAVFDQYQISRIEVEVISFNNFAAMDSAVGNQTMLGLCHLVLDPDDATAPAASISGIQALQQYETYQVHRYGGPSNPKISLSPRVALAAYASGAFTSYAVGSRDQWVDVGSPAVEHYGVKGINEVYSSGGATPTLFYRMHVKALVRFRTSR